MRRPPTPEHAWSEHARSGACLTCCGPTSRRFAHCFACRAVSRSLNLPLQPALPAHVCPVPGPLYRMLMGYKESPVAEVRRHYSRCVEDSFATFLADHLACLCRALGGGADLVAPVPSSSRPGRASLERADGLADVVNSTLGSGARWLPSILQRADGDIGPMRPNARAFAVSGSGRVALHGSRVILLDDVYVSGSRAQSAAAALRLSGARTVLIVPLGRVVRPERFATHAAFVAASGTGNGNGHVARCVLGEAGERQAGGGQAGAGSE
jgi:predicted amidophosphoribosyltransferase